MKQFFKKLSIYDRVSVFLVVSSLAIFLILLFLCFISLYDIPLGISLGLLFNALFIFLQGRINSSKRTGEHLKLNIVLIISKFILLIIVCFLLGFLYYKYNVHVVNLFAFMGGYLLATVALVIAFVIKGKDENI